MLALQYGGAGPWWANILVAAEAWGCPPWEIAGGWRLQWMLRWQVFTELRNKLKD